MFYLSEGFLQWFKDSDSGHLLDHTFLERAYVLWNHAASLIRSDSTELQLSDGLSNLKRAVNQRLKMIEENYQLRQAPVSSSRKGYLELLEQFGVIRPFMLKQLMELRNDIEHNDARPPSHMRCQELLDVIWYFLRSTDGLLKVVPDSVVFHSSRFDDSSHWVMAKIDPFKGWSITLSGWVPIEFISDSPNQGFIKLLNGTRKNRDESLEDSQLHETREFSSWWFSGVLQPRESITEPIIKAYMTL